MNPLVEKVLDNLAENNPDDVLEWALKNIRPGIYRIIDCEYEMESGAAQLVGADIDIMTYEFR